MEAGDYLRRAHGVLFGHPMNVSFIDEYVCGTARAMSYREFHWLETEKGIKAILSMTETPLSLKWVSSLSDYLHLAVKNHTAPSASQLQEAVTFITRNIQAKNKVAVHCAAGQGRTGTVLAAYLCSSRKISAEEAIRRIRELRPGSIERKSGQEEAIKEFRACVEEKERQS